MVISARYFYHFGCICVDTHRKVAICDGSHFRLQRQVTTYEESHISAPEAMLQLRDV